MSVRIERADGTRVWEEVKLRGDETPDGGEPGKKSIVYESPDGKVVLYFWTRSRDIGVMNPTTGPADRGQKFDIILDGEATIVDADGTSHTVGAGEVLTYSMSDGGEWRQEGPLTKLAIAVYE